MGILDTEVIENQTINLFDLYQVDKPTIVESKTFKGCRLIGPANIVFAGLISIKDTRFEQCDLVCFKLHSNIHTALMFRNVVIMGNSVIHRTTIMVDPGATQNFPRDQFITEVPPAATIEQNRTRQ
jgi:hypothetical protein